MSAMNAKLSICTVNYNSSDFILTMLYCLKRITKNNYKVIIRDNNSKKTDYCNLKKNIKKYSNVKLYRVENFNLNGSKAHAVAINDLITKIDTKYGVILDADFTFLHKNWDEILISEISEEYPIIGTQSSEFSRKPLDFPYVFGILFDFEIFKKLNIDFKPSLIDAGSPIIKDTGQKLRELYLKNGYRGKLITNKRTAIYKKGPFHKINCSEFYLNGYDRIFGSHFRRGSTVNTSKYIGNKKMTFFKIPIIGFQLLKIKVKKEKKTWTKICRRIVNSIT